MTEPADIDLFAGPGGWCVAAARLGVKPAGIETDETAVATARAAGQWRIREDVSKIDPRHAGSVRLLMGSPPCTAFTNTGKGLGRIARPAIIDGVRQIGAGVEPTKVCARVDEQIGDPTAALVLEPLRWVALTRPEVIALEQVPPVLPVWQAMAEVLEADGYSVWTGVLSTERYGLPQTRTRAILIASRRGDHMAEPPPRRRKYRPGVTQYQRDAAEPDLAPWRSIRNALGLREGLSGAVRSNYSTGGDPSRRGLRTFDQPAATITGKLNRNRLLLPTGEVGMSVAQGAALQGFPAHYPWQGTKEQQCQQIGNAVPPPFAWHVLRAALGLPVEPYPLADTVPDRV